MPLATGGNITINDISGTTYNVHTFTTSGTFTVTDGGLFEYLIVAGGGGAPVSGDGNAGIAGGGGGGVLIGSIVYNTGATVTVTVGAGGVNSNGSNSSLTNLSPAIGGGVGGFFVQTGGTGGSGGGGGGRQSAAGGAGTPGQGFNGGAARPDNIAANSAGGGGGGAGGVGGAGTPGLGGSGGVGIQSTLSGAARVYAGGGGGMANGTGGAGGSGGGGNGVSSGGNTTFAAGGAGTINTGGGGGGGNLGSTGGSGIVIIRYTSAVVSAIANGGSYSTQVVNTLGNRTTYGIHTFTSSGNLTITQTGLLEYLVVGGGGGGGSDMGGGGGAGGYLAGNIVLNAGTYAVTVGAGGTGAPAGINQVRGVSGASSAIIPTGYRGHSFSFDGVGDGINCGTQSAFAIGSGAFCLEGWIYNHRLKDFSCLWTTRADNSNYADAYHMGWNGVGGVSLYVGSTSFAAGASGSIKAGQWQHIAMTRNAAGNLATFVDGIRVGYTASLTTNFTRSLLGLGDFPTTKAEGINGYISNARIVVGNSVYDPTLTTCTVPTAPLTAITGTVILTAQNFSFTDNSANNFTLTAQGDAQTSHFTPFINLAISAAGGGGGASAHTAAGAISAAASGGSGGGASGEHGNNGVGISGQGTSGSASAGRWYPGGGGGAGGAGGTNPANGGIGRSNAILGTSYFWAGGGAGGGYTGIAGNGGLGGGGGGAPKTTGGGGLPGGSTYTQAITPYALVGTFGTIGSLSAQTNVPGGNGVANSGGGGGGSAHYNINNIGGTGGSGIVIVKYLLSSEPTGLGGPGNIYAGGGGGAGMDGYVGSTRQNLVRVFTSSGNLTVSGTGTVEYLIVAGGGGGGSDMGGGGGGGGYLAGFTTLTSGTYLVSVGAGGAGAPAGISQPRGANGGDSAIQPFANSTSNYSYFFDTNGDSLSLASNAAFDIGANDASVELWFWMYRLDGTYHTFCGQNSGTGATIRIAYNSGSLYYSINNDTARGANTSVDIQTWYHVVVTYTGGTARFFVNGQLRDVATGLGTIAARAEAYVIGQEDSLWMDGYISNFRFCNGSIPTAYQTTSNTLFAQIFTPPTAALTRTSQGATAAHVRILTCQSPTIVDNSVNNFTITRSGDVSATRFNPFDNLVAAGGGGGASEYSNNNSPASSGGSGGGTAGDISVTFGQGIRPNVQGLVGQGFAGGASGGRYYPSGGGGAGAAGAAVPANGGNGLQNSILGTSYFWAAGGGGAGYSGNPGNGGLGGGGGGAPKQSSTIGVAGVGGYNPGTDGTVGTLVAQTNVPGGNGGTNTGSGGGGGAYYNINNNGGAGGSGIVVIKYRTDQLTITGGQLVLDGGTVTDTVYAGGFGGNGFALSSGLSGTLGGAGGGGSGVTIGGGGGGIDVWGAQAHGTGGAAGQGGFPGSINQIFGTLTTGTTAGNAITGNGGLYGGGGGGFVTSTYDPAVGNGANGALLFIWSSTVDRAVPTYPALASTNVNNTGGLGATNTTNSLTLDKINFVSAGAETPLIVLDNTSGISRTANTVVSYNLSDGAQSQNSLLPLNYAPLSNLFKPATPIDPPSSDLFSTATNVLRGSLGISTVISTETRANVVGVGGTPTGRVDANNVVAGQATVVVYKQDEWMLLSSDPAFPVDYNTTYNYTAAKPVTVSNDPRNKFLRANYLQKDVTGQSPTDPQEYL